MKSISTGWLGSDTLTRRTATVTISAPDASTAAAFCSKSLYLPVPTISREVKVRPATVHVSVKSSTPANEVDDLIGVAILDDDLAEGRARDDLQVALDRDPLRIQPDLGDQLRQRSAWRHPAVLAVDCDACTTIEGHWNDAFASRMNLAPI